MVVRLLVLKEEVREVQDKTYITVSGSEVASPPLLQMMDYGLRLDELQHKGKLLGKTLELQVDSIPRLFSGRPHLTGKILKVS